MKKKQTIVKVSILVLIKKKTGIVFTFSIRKHQNLVTYRKKGFYLLFLQLLVHLCINGFGDCKVTKRLAFVCK